MLRHCLTFVAAAALTGAAAPAIAHDGPAPPPEAGPPPAWPGREGPHPGPWLPEGPYSQTLPPGAYPGGPYHGPMPYPGGPMPYPHAPMGYPGGPAPYPGPDLPPPPPLPPGAYPAPPCGCAAAYGYPAYAYSMVWVPVQIHTRDIYSAPLRREREIVEEHVVREEVVETKTVPVRRTKYVKAVPMTKQKIYRTK